MITMSYTLMRIARRHENGCDYCVFLVVVIYKFFSDIHICSSIYHLLLYLKSLKIFPKRFVRQAAFVSGNLLQNENQKQKLH